MYGTQFAQTIPPRALDSDQSHFLHHLAGSDLSANRDLTWVTGNVDRQVTLQGDPTLADWFDQSVKFSSSPTFTGLALLGFSGVVKSSLGVLSGLGGFSDLAFAAADVQMGPYKFTAFQLESSISSGTPPLVVASTDMVSNLNADLLDGQHASAFLVDISGEGLGDLSDVNTTGVSTGDFLQKSAGDWVDFDLFAANNTWAGTNEFDDKVYLADTNTWIDNVGGNLTYAVTTTKNHNWLIDSNVEMSLGANVLSLEYGLGSADFDFSTSANLLLTINGTDVVNFKAAEMKLTGQLLVDADNGGTANYTSYVHGSTAAPGLGSTPSWGNKPVGTNFGTWLHVYIGTTLHYIPTQA